ncbi:Gfo/Idh/MocA family protein [Streptomyces hokutonensis]|uniref:Gfo/Idh/MocA family protein n=1 Tax=Streptomyces hokutonensis TaxID=1306990 RepID=UPI00037332F2|nr:Gfo/Idh/MocA family oxidoreductase [Streptomyces hokutonensis]
MSDTIRVGVIGANAERGWASATHLPALAGLPGLELSAVANTRAGVAARTAEQWGAAHSFTDPLELIEHPEVDLVAVSVQLPVREDLVAQVISAGKHVYCEWPLGLDAVRAGRYRDLAEKAGVRSAIGLQGRQHPAIRLLRDLIAEGRIGEVLSATLSYSASTPGGNLLPQRYGWLADRDKAVNTLTIVGAHALDMFRCAVGDFTELSATLATRTPRMVIAETGENITVTSPDHVLVQGVLESGALATAQILTGGLQGAGMRIEVYGREGRLVLEAENNWIASSELYVGLARAEHDVVRIAVPDIHRTVLPDEPPAVRNVGRVYTELAAAIHDGGRAEPDFGTAVELHRLIDAVNESADSGRRTTV